MRDVFLSDVIIKALEGVLRQKNLKQTKEDGQKNPAK